MTARFLVADVMDGLATLEAGSVDLVITSPPFLALRSYLPADHESKAKEIGSEATPAEFIDVLLKVTAELRRVLAPHGSICIELGDTYAGSGGAGGDYLNAGLRDGQPGFDGSASRGRTQDREYDGGASDRWDFAKPGTNSRLASGAGWPLSKSRTLIPSLYEIALAYGINPLTGTESPAGQWRIRNIVTWARPNPPVGALGDKWRPATSDLIVACTSSKRYWDDLATRRPAMMVMGRNVPGNNTKGSDDLSFRFEERVDSNAGGAPLLDYWVIPPGGYQGAHYAVFPQELVVPCIQAMAPPKVCRTCGQPSRRIHQAGGGLGAVIAEARSAAGLSRSDLVPYFEGHYKNAESIKAQISNWELEKNVPMGVDWVILKDLLVIGDDWDHLIPDREAVSYSFVSHHPSGWTQDSKGNVYQRLPSRMDRHVREGWSDCGHDNWRPALILDPFAGSGTTLAVATGFGHDAVGIDIDQRNEELARDRVGPFLFESVEVTP